MTATDELRRLLDECGIEWKGFEGDPLGFVKAETAWGEVDGLGTYSYWIAEYFDGTTLLNIGNPTPEQAVEATLGRGTCNADETDTWECVRDDLGGYGKTLTVHVMECTECGHTYEHVNGGYEFCPRCGRKVIG